MKQYNFLTEGWFSNLFKGQEYPMTRSMFFGPLVKFCTAAVIIEDCYNYEEDPFLSKLSKDDLNEICYAVFGSCTIFSDYDGTYDSIKDDVNYVLRMCNGKTINALTKHPKWKNCISAGTINAKNFMKLISRIVDWSWK